MRPITKLLVANRSEIAIRVFRSAHELGIRTVAIYAHEDRFALHRFKADEAYLAGKPGEPIRSYLDIEGIVALAKAHGVDGIHPGYGFLSENPEFAAACVSNCSKRSATRLPPANSPGRRACRSSPAAPGRWRASPMRSRSRRTSAGR